MRYAIVTDTYAPDLNGVALTLQAYVAGLRARGHTVEVIRPHPPDALSSANEVGPVRVRGLRLPRYPSLRVGLPVQARLQAAWRAQRPDAIYVATETLLGGSAIRAARALGIPVVTALHTRFDLYMADYGLRALAPLALAWMRRFHDAADATVVATQALAAWLQAQRIGHAVVLPRAVDCAQFNPARRDPALRAAWGLPPGGLAVIHVGRIAAEKNLPLAIRAFRLLQQQRPEARMVLVGDGPLREPLARAHPDLMFVGAQRGEALGRHFASADLFLFPSRSETFGNVVLEAMASGVPQVAFDLGAASEHLVDGLHGARVANDAQGDAAFVAAALRLAQDDVGRAAMALAGRRAMQRLTPAQVAADLDALLAAPRTRAASVPVRQADRHAHRAA